LKKSTEMMTADDEPRIAVCTFNADESVTDPQADIHNASDGDGDNDGDGRMWECGVLMLPLTASTSTPPACVADFTLPPAHGRCIDAAIAVATHRVIVVVAVADALFRSLSASALTALLRTYYARLRTAAAASGRAATYDASVVLCARDVDDDEKNDDAAVARTLFSAQRCESVGDASERMVLVPRRVCCQMYTRCPLIIEFYSPSNLNLSAGAPRLFVA
jgi:hypothetical protein